MARRPSLQFEFSSAWALATGSAVGLIFLGVLTRLLPHPPNFTAMLAVAIFAGAFYSKPAQALAVPLLAAILSDLLIGWHTGFWSVYLGLVLCTVLGRWMLTHPSLQNVTFTGCVAATLFFIWTNFAVWLQGDLYPMTALGLWTCYVAAIPFFHYTLLSTLLYGYGLLAAFRFFRHHKTSNSLLLRS